MYRVSAKGLTQEMERAYKPAQPIIPLNFLQPHGTLYDKWRGTRVQWHYRSAVTRATRNRHVMLYDLNYLRKYIWGKSFSQEPVKSFPVNPGIRFPRTREFVSREPGNSFPGNLGLRFPGTREVAGVLFGFYLPIYDFSPFHSFNTFLLTIFR